MGNIRRPARGNQKKPQNIKTVVAKVLPFRHSMIPEMTCAAPP